jgi:spermidine synthase
MNHATKPNRFLFAIVLIGFSAMMSQIILLRELIIVFLGNELTLGIILGIWLLGTAIGSGIEGRFVTNIKNPILSFIIIQLILTVLLPTIIITIRVSYISQGEMISLLRIIVLPATVLFPICILSGMLYTLGCHIYHQITNETSTAIGKIYLFEAIGAGLASFLVSIILINFLETFQLAIIICSVNIISVTFLFILFYNKYKSHITIATFIFIVIIIFLFPWLNQFSLHKFWKNYKLEHNETTIYGNIAVTRLDESTNFFQNGVLMFTSPDLFYAEEAVHFALLEHPNPQNVLLIGGGTGGSLRQILLHPSIQRVDYVEIDPKIIELSREFLPPQETDVLSDPKVHVINKDGRLFVKQANQSYDVVIINIPDPQTTLINRFYTYEFFKQAKKILSSNGIISFSITSSENVIGPDLQNLLSCLYQTMALVFTDIVLIPGDTNHFIGCVQSNILTTEANDLINRLKKRNLNTVYLREYYIPFRMSKERVAYLKENVVNSKFSKINHDFKPIGNYYNLVVWTTHFNQNIRNIFLFLDRLGQIPIFILAAVIILPFLVRLFLKNGKQRSFTLGIFASIIIIGFSEISLEIIIIHIFQAMYGYVYFQLALILSSFMVGLSVGSYTSINKNKKVFLQLKRIQFLMALYPLFVYRISKILMTYSITNTLLLQTIFFLLTFWAGFLAGYQYPLACHLLSKINPNVGQTGGSIYSADLMGAFGGALLTSAIFIPILGISQTCWVLFILNITVFIGLLLSKEKT